MGVKYVFLPKAPLDISGPREARLLATTPQFTVVYNGPAVGRLPPRRPRSPSPSRWTRGARSRSSTSTTSRCSSTSHGRATYLVKFTYTPYWQVTDGVGTLTKGPGDFVVLHASQPGFYGMRVQVDLESLGQAVPKL